FFSSRRRHTRFSRDWSSDVCSSDLIWVGKLDQHKNWRLALVYTQLLKELLGPVHLYMVGGYTAPEATAQAFFELAYRLGVSDSVTWLDRVENVQLASLYHRCAASGGAMLVTSRDESFGMAAGSEERRVGKGCRRGGGAARA